MKNTKEAFPKHFYVDNNERNREELQKIGFNFQDDNVELHHNMLMVNNSSKSDGSIKPTSFWQTFNPPTKYINYNSKFNERFKEEGEEVSIDILNKHLLKTETGVLMTVDSSIIEFLDNVGIVGHEDGSKFYNINNHEYEYLGQVVLNKD